jgi:hypothetical protein
MPPTTVQAYGQAAARRIIIAEVRAWSNPISRMATRKAGSAARINKQTASGVLRQYRGTAARRTANAANFTKGTFDLTVRQHGRSSTLEADTNVFHPPMLEPP